MQVLFYQASVRGNEQIKALEPQMVKVKEEQYAVYQELIHLEG